VRHSAISSLPSSRLALGAATAVHSCPSAVRDNACCQPSASPARSRGLPRSPALLPSPGSELRGNRAKARTSIRKLAACRLVKSMRFCRRAGRGHTTLLSHGLTVSVSREQRRLRGAVAASG
jgi:hypothetical protein